MKKEPLSIIIVKTLLAVIIFVGLGTIIIGGGYLIGKDYKNETNNKITEPINQEMEDYYDALEKRCAIDSCCLASLKIMRENNYREVDKDGKCPEGFNKVATRCIYHPLDWCEPIEKRCAKAGEFVNSYKLKNKTDYPNICCPGLERLSAYKIDVNGGCKLTRETDFSTCMPCGNGVCETINGFEENVCNCLKDCKDETKDWRTYRNEELKYEMKYPKDWTVKENNYLHSWGKYIKNIQFFNPDEKYYLLFGIKQKNSDFELDGRTGIGAGDFIKSGRTIKINGIEVEIDNLVYEGKIKEVWYKYFYMDDFVGKATFMFGSNADLNYDLDMRGADEIEIAEKILESFKFMDQKEIDISNWQTYRDEKNGFEIKYQSSHEPSTNSSYGAGSVSFEIEGENSKYLLYSKFGIVAYENNKELSAKEFAENYKRHVSKINKDYLSGVDIIEQETQINGYDAYLYDGVAGDGRLDDKNKLYFIVHKDKTVSISFASSAPDYDMYDNLKIFNKMLSTFKFTK